MQAFLDELEKPHTQVATSERRYLHLAIDAEYLAIALWIIHTHVFDRFRDTGGAPASDTVGGPSMPSDWLKQVASPT
jgi:hypothetical protein